MWTQSQIDEIVKALWHLPADKLLEVKGIVLDLQERFGYPAPVDCDEGWTPEDERVIAKSFLARRAAREEKDEQHGVPPR